MIKHLLLNRELTCDAKSQATEPNVYEAVLGLQDLYSIFNKEV